MDINVAGIHGEDGTGFELPGGKGPFNCGNCEYFSGGSCGQKDMMEKSKQPRTMHGRVKVVAEACCEFIERVGPVKKSSAKNWLPRRKSDGKT